jgi:hypothetical protein
MTMSISQSNSHFCCDPAVTRAGKHCSGALVGQQRNHQTHMAPGWLISKAPLASPDTVPTAAPILFTKSGPCRIARAVSNCVLSILMGS